MEDQPKFERMLRILLLLSNGMRYTPDELAERFEMSSRSVQRYFSTFRKAGILVDCDNGKYSVRRIDKPFRELQELLHFSEEEAYILLRAIQSIDDTNMLKSNLINKLYSLYNNDRIVETIVKPENSEKVHGLLNAIREQKQVLLRQYRSSHGNIVRDRLVEPFDFSVNYISFWAYEPESQSCKLFSTSRVGQVIVLEKKYQFAGQHVKQPMDIFRISSPKLLPVHLALSLRAYNLLIEEFPLSEKYITRKNDNLWHFESMVCGYEGVGRFVMGLLSDVNIIVSEDFKNFIREKIKNAASHF